MRCWPTRGAGKDDGEDAMDTTMLSDIRDIGPEQFDALDAAAGAWGCYGRLLLRQADGRWRANYLRAVSNESLKAAVPVYAHRGKTWPVPDYDVTAWPLPDRLREACTP